MTQSEQDPAAPGSGDEVGKVNSPQDTPTLVSQQGALLTYGIGIDQPVGDRLHIPAGNSTVDALHDALQDLPDGKELWCGLNRWTGNHRNDNNWEASFGVATDLDFYLPNGKRPEPGSLIMDGLVATALSGDLGGNLVYATPRGVRVICLFKEPVTDRLLFKRAVLGAGELAARGLRMNGFVGYEVDQGVVTRATTQPFYAPRTTVNGYPRDEAVHIICRALCDPHELAIEAPELSVVSKPVRARRVDNEPESEVEAAFAAYDDAHQEDWKSYGRTCPACGHSGCFGPLPQNASKWFCFSDNHARDSAGCGVRTAHGWLGGALDIEAHKRGVSPFELLLEKGLIKGNKGRVSELPRNQVPKVCDREDKGQLLALDEGRELLQAKVNKIVDAKPLGLTVLEASPGLGKTYAVTRAIQAMIEAGELDTRVLFVADTHEQLAEIRTDSGLTLLKSNSVIRYGRTEDRSSPGFCEDLLGGRISEKFSKGGHSVMKSWCRASEEHRCPHATSCPYLTNSDLAREARVVFATKALLACQPRFADKFRLIVVDEGLSDLLVKDTTISRTEVRTWVRSVDHRIVQGLGDPDENRLLKSFLTTLGRAIEESGSPVHMTAPLLRVWDEVESPENSFCAALNHARAGSGEMPFERPYRSGSELIIPRVAFRTLMLALERDLAEETGTVTLTRNGIQFIRPNYDLIRMLDTKAVMNLDATPNTALLSMMLSKFKVERIQVEEHTYVTQITDRLLTRQDLSKLIPRLNRLLDRLLKDEKLPLIMVPKQFNPDAGKEAAKNAGPEEYTKWKKEREEKIKAGGVIYVSSNQSVRYAHFGGQSRGLNRYRDVSIIVVIGHHCHNIGSVQRMVDSIRSSHAATGSQSKERWMPYAGQSRNGLVTGREVRQHADPDVDRIITWSRDSSVVQTVGRGRPALRAADSPLRVLMLAAHPITGLSVDELTSLDELEEGVGLTSSSNRARSRRFEEEVQGAAEALQGRGERITVLGVTQELGGGTGGSRRTRVKRTLIAQGFQL